MTIFNEHDFPLLPSQEKKQGLASNNQQTRASLDDLPDELIVEVLEYLSSIDLDKFRFSWLPKLALTNRRLYRIVSGRLYERYDNRYSQSYLFLRSLVSNPWIAEQVREVYIRVMHERRRPWYTPTAQDKRVIKEGLRAIEMPSWKPWATKCNENFGYNALLPSTMLLFTPNVTSITYVDFVEEPTMKPIWVDMISKSAVGDFGGVHHFEQLRSIKIDGGLSILSNFAPLFKLQSLRKLHLLAVVEYDFTVGDGIISRLDEHARELQRFIPPTCNNIEELVLERCFYSELCLDRMVSSPRRLKTFKYSEEPEDHWTWGHRWKWRELPRDRSKTIIKILRRHEASLETLHVFADYQVEKGRKGRIHLHDDMTAFTSLKEISCPLGMIMPGQDDVYADRLPCSLRTFRTPVRHWTKERKRLGALKHMLDNRATYTPQLQEVRVVDPAHSPSNWEDFTKISSKAGVEFVQELGDWAYGAWGEYSSDEDSSNSSLEE